MDEFPERNLANYVWRIFYYNKKDPRLYLPKSDPTMGTTMNFAKTHAVVGTITMMAFFIFVIYMITSHQK